MFQSLFAESALYRSPFFALYSSELVPKLFDVRASRAVLEQALVFFRSKGLQNTFLLEADSKTEVLEQAFLFHQYEEQIWEGRMIVLH
jgi:hypothetical protein